MRRSVLFLAMICMALGLLPVLGAASAEAPPTLDRSAATQLLAMVNAERLARGLAPLVDDPALRGWAERWSLHMATTGVLAHNDALFSRSAHRSLGIKVFAENVAWDDATFGVVGAHKQFVSSAHHHDNMLGAAYRLAGFAVARDSKGRVWVTEDFGTPRVSVPPAPAPRPAPKPAPKPATAAPARPAARPATPARPAPAPRRAAPVRAPAPPIPASAAAPLWPAAHAVVRDAPESTSPSLRPMGVALSTAGEPVRSKGLFLAPLLVLALAALAARRVGRVQLS